MEGGTKTVEHEKKEERRRFLGTLVDTLGVSLVGNMLPGKCIIRTSHSANQKAIVGAIVLRVGAKIIF